MLTGKKYKLIGLTALAAAVALPGLSAVADTASSITSRSPDAIARDFGRASGDPYWARREPADPPRALVNAYEETKTFVTQPPIRHGPERYGRAGGFVGLDEMKAPIWSSTHPRPATANPAEKWDGRAGTPSVLDHGRG